MASNIANFVETLNSWVHNWDQTPGTFVVAFLYLFICDTLVSKRLYDAQSSETKTKSGVTRQTQKSRWYSLHVFANLFVCVTALNPFFTSLSDPAFAGDPDKYSDVSMFGSASNFPLVMIISAHVYHMVAFSDLTSEDYFHHLMFIPTMGFPGLYWNWGPSQSTLCLFISGLPGGIEYLFLTLYKLGFTTDRSLLKKVAALQNTWCRWPGIIIAAFLIYMGWVYERSQAPAFFSFWLIGLSCFNATYYGFMSISAVMKQSIISQFNKDGPAMFTDTRKIKVERPGS